MKQRIPVDELRFGMYISELDRPWTDTPFTFQGFVLSTQQQLDALKKYCSTVIIDVERSSSTETPAPRVAYPERAPLEQEIGPAKIAYTGGRELTRDVMSAVRVGRALDAAQLKSAVSAMKESVLRNPDALLLFSQLRSKGEYTESHALDVSIYMITFGRFLQLEPGQIEFLGYLGLLQDVGKVRLPKELLEKRGRLTIEEFELAKLHVNYSVEILRATPGLPGDLARVAALHRERHALQVAWRVLRRAPRRAVHPLHRHLPGGQPGRAQHRRSGRGHRAEPHAAAAAARDGDPRRAGQPDDPAQAARPRARAQGEQGPALPHPRHAGVRRGAARRRRALRAGEVIAYSAFW